MWIFSDIASIPFLMVDVFDYTDGITWFYASLIRNFVGSHSTTRSKINKNDLYPLWQQNLDKHHLPITWKGID